MMQKKNTTLTEDKTRLNDRIKNLEDEIKQLKEELKSFKDNRNDNDNACSKCNELYAEIDSLKNEKNSLAQQIYANKCVNCESKNATIKSYGDAINRVDTFTNELLNTNDEQNALLIQLSNNQKKIDDSLRSLNICISDAGDNSVHVTGNSSGNTQHLSRSLNPNSGTFTPNESTADNTRTTGTMPLNNFNKTKDKNGNFLPPNKNDLSQSDNSGKVQQIYVGEFLTHVQSDEIVTHILQKTDISDSSLFVVEKLVGPREDIKRKTFVSFKITTINDDVFNAINNNELWGPNQSARAFDNNKYRNVRNSDSNRNEHRSSHRFTPGRFGYRGRDDYRHENRNNYRGRNNFRRDDFRRDDYRGRDNYRRDDYRLVNKRERRGDYSRERPSNNSFNRRPPSRYEQPPRFRDRFYDNNNNQPRQPSNYDNRSPNYRPNNQHQGAQRPLSSNGNENFTNYQRQDPRVRKNSDRQNFFEANLRNQNPLRQSHDNHQYRSTESVYRY